MEILEKTLYTLHIPIGIGLIYHVISETSHQKFQKYFYGSLEIPPHTALVSCVQFIEVT
jgi:hypothetical protein